MAAVAPSPASMNAPLSKSGSPVKSEEAEKAGATIKVVDVSSADSAAPAAEDEQNQDTTDPALKDEKGKSPPLQRPPIRPVAAMRSNFDLEPNVFEQSFRNSSHHGSSSSLSDRERSGKRSSPPRGGDETSTKHNALPPLSSLTSPAAADPSQFPWLAAQSLRTGPLSPAMLGGPSQAHGANGNRANENGNGEHQAFDGSNFRTGFTPGTGSGFTPGYNALMGNSNFSSLPLPSPNTAAFLNMVTNSTPLGEGESGENQENQNGNQQQGQGQGQAPNALPPHMQNQGMAPYSQGNDQETITPGTFSALTGALNDMNRQNGQQHGPPPGLGAPPYYQMNGPGPQHQMHPMAPHPSHHHGQPHIDYAQQSANAASQAANGLFLLSQAHQELSKREEEGRGPSPLTAKRTSVGAVPPGSGKGPGPVPNLPGPSGSGGQKRKSDADLNGAGTGGKGGKKGKKADAVAAAAIMKKDESASPSFSMMDDDDDGEVRMINGKPETEEDKRKNFLERNRQAALKCRQRKKAWLTELQQKVDSLATENEALQRTIGGLHDEVGRLTSLLMQRDGAMGVQQQQQAYGRPIR